MKEEFFKINFTYFFINFTMCIYIITEYWPEHSFKDTVMQIEKVVYVFQKYPENVAFQLFTIWQ